jgi:hypothetical protein
MPPLTGLIILRIAILQICRAYGAHPFSAGEKAIQMLPVVFPHLPAQISAMTQAVEKAFQEAAKLPGEEQEVFAGFILDELAFRAAGREGIEAADRGEVTPIEDVRKMIPKWASR